MDSRLIPKDNKISIGADSDSGSIESFAPRRVQSFLTEIGREIRNACDSLRKADSNADRDEVYQALLKLIPFSAFERNIATECEFRLDEAISKTSFAYSLEFLLLYAFHLAIGNIPLPKSKACLNLIQAISDFNSEGKHLADLIAERLQRRKKFGFDILIGGASAFCRQPLQKPSHPAFEHKWKYFENALDIEFRRQGNVVRTVKVPKNAMQILRREVANGELLILDEDFLLRRFDIDGQEIACTTVPNKCSTPTKLGFRYERGRCLECDLNCSRIYVSDMNYVFEFDGALNLTNTFELNHLAHTTSWDDEFLLKKRRSNGKLKLDAIRSELEILGLREAPKSLDELRTAFKSMIRQCHPDLNPQLADANDRTIRLYIAVEAVRIHMSGEERKEIADEVSIHIPGPEERIQTVTVLDDGCLIGTYKGGVYRILNRSWNLIEQANFWLSRVFGELGHRAYRSVVSTVVVPKDGSPWEVPQGFPIVKFSESRVAMADGSLFRLYDMTGKKLSEIVCPNSVLDVEFEADRCIISTTNDRIHCIFDQLEFGVTQPSSHVIVPTSPLRLELDHIRKTWTGSKIHSTIEEAIYRDRVLSDSILTKLVDEQGVDAINSQGMTSLHWLAAMGTGSEYRDAAIKMMLKLIKYGANINAQVDSWSANENRYPDGRTALHLAIDGAVGGGEADAIPIIRLLLDQGINPNLSDFKGAPPMRLVVNNDLLKIAELLLSHGADPHAVDKRGASLIYKAKSRKFDKMTKLLLKYAEK